MLMIVLMSMKSAALQAHRLRNANKQTCWQHMKPMECIRGRAKAHNSMGHNYTHGNPLWPSGTIVSLEDVWDGMEIL